VTTDIDSDDQVEGLDSEAGADGWGDYPLDSVFVRSEIRTVGDAVNRINKGRYVMDPDFQRAFVWDELKQSKLIESCVMRIPLPVFYVAEAKDGSVIVVDGLQRLTTFHRFKNGTLKLQLGTDEKPHPLFGMTYPVLPLNLQERIDDTQLTMYILDAKAPERARLDIFERVNGGTALTRQQMRNALFNGPATRWLKDTSESTLFKEATGRSLDTKSMRDREAINRFCAFTILGWESYSGGDMDGFLGDALDRMNSMTDSELDELRLTFDRSLRINLTLFGRHAFRKSLSDNDPYVGRSILNIALFEVSTVFLSRISSSPTSDDAEAIKGAVLQLLSDPSFVHDITYSTNSTRQVHGRFRTAQHNLADFLRK
jgi:hypothetical protein